MITEFEKDKLKKILIEHEGLKLKPYRDTVGRLTIGVGRNLDNVGISPIEANFLLNNDIERVIEAIKDEEYFKNLEGDRKLVVMDMVFNLGPNGFKKFTKLIEAIKWQKWSDAAREMRDSTWYTQVGKRGQKLANAMEEGIL